MIKPHPVDRMGMDQLFMAPEIGRWYVYHMLQLLSSAISPRGTTELKHIINVPADSNNCHAKRETLVQTDMSLFKFLENQ